MRRLVFGFMLWLLALPAAAQEALTLDDMRALAQGRFATLTTHLVLADDPAPACDVSKAGQTYALLFGADSFGPGTATKLEGAETSVDLLAETLIARGVDAGNVIRLTGATATRAGLARAVSALLSKLQCTDMVVAYVSAVSADTASIAGWMSAGADTSDWIAAASASDPVMRAIVDAGPFLLTNPGTEDREEILSAGALSEIVTRLRNRAAHVTVVLDTTYAAAFDLSTRQMAVDGRLLWRDALSQNAPRPYGPVPTPLMASAGALSVLYGADKTSMSAEMQLPEDSPDAAVYGLFVFKLAAALRADAALTVPSIGRSIAALTLAPRYAEFQNHVIETTDASLPILAEATTPAPDLLPQDGPEVIRITSPEPSRAAAALDSATLTLQGQVDWPEDTMIVLVGKEQALSRADGTFQHEVTLERGVNRIEIVALTRDNRQHSKVVEVTYDGAAQVRTGAGKRYALMIANQTYGGATGMPPLATPFADVDALAEVLQRRFGFQTVAVAADGAELPLILKDAGRAQIETTLFKLSQIAGAADQVLIYYGGHGVYEEVTGTAFWVPADAVAGVPPSYLSASGISEALLRFQAGSVIVVSDSCYSGALMRGGDTAGAFTKVTEADRATMLARLAEQRARVLMTSGANEPVADGGGDGHSIFARALLEALTQAKTPVAAREVFDDFVFPMVVGRADQEPQYRPIAKSGHEGGDFVFTPLAD